MKIVVVHNSIFGNGIIAAKEMTELFNPEEVEIYHNRDISPKELAQKDIDILIIGSAVRKFVLSWESQRWIRSFAKHLKANGKTIPFVLGYVTHMREFENIYKKFDIFSNLITSIENFDRIYPETITLQVEKIEGPFKPEAFNKLANLKVKIIEISKELDTNLMVVDK